MLQFNDVSSSSSEWAEMYALVSDMVRRLKTEIDQLEQRVNQLNAGMGGDVNLMRNKIHQLTQVAKDLCEEIRGLSKLGQHDTERSNQLMQLENRAIGEASRLQRLSRGVQMALRQQANATQAKVLFSPSQSGGQHAGGLPGPPSRPGSELGQQQQQQSQLATDDELLKLEAEEKAMRLLEDDILKVNEIFSTLAGFVHEQGALVDSIEAQTETAHVQIQSATHNLTHAIRHRNSSRRKKFICAIIVIVVLLILTLILYLALRN